MNEDDDVVTMEVADDGGVLASISFPLSAKTAFIIGNGVTCSVTVPVNASDTLNLTSSSPKLVVASVGVYQNTATGSLTAQTVSSDTPVAVTVETVSSSGVKTPVGTISFIVTP